MTPPVDARTRPANAGRRSSEAAPKADGQAAPTTSSVTSASIIRSKVQPPPLRSSTLERSRLLEWLDQRADERLVLLAADAGFGKTTLLADWARRADAQCFWYRLETSDAEWSTYLNYLVAAVRELHPDFGALTEAHLRQVAVMDPPMEIILATFLSELDAVCQPSTVFIFDDFHLVDQSDDVRRIMGRLFEQAPRTARFVLAGRSRPELPVGRMAAQGRLAELTTDDLRFTRKEIEALFDSAYSQPQEAETYSVIESRTEGWAASLQLVSTSIATRAPGEIRSFIRDLSGADGPIYDFLAEEVLAHLPETVQRVLLHAALLDRIDPTLVAAAMSVSARPVALDEIVESIRHVEKLGLISRGSKDDKPRRIHPLLKGFLLRQLNESVASTTVVMMRIAIAKLAEPRDWLTAARQFAAIPDTSEVIRVVGSAVLQALGTGSWGAAAELLTNVSDADLPPMVKAIRARQLVAAGASESAVELLSSIDRHSLQDHERVVVGLARAAALHASGRADDLWEEVHWLEGLAHDDPQVHWLVRAWHDMLEACRGGSLSTAFSSITRLADEARRSGLLYFAAVSLHNAAEAALAQSKHSVAQELARQAIELADMTLAGSQLRPSASMVTALAEMESGDWAAGRYAAARAVATASPPADVLADAAYVAGVSGAVDDALLLLDRLGKCEADSPLGLGVNLLRIHAHIATLTSDGQFQQAADLLGQADHDLDGASRWSFLRAQSAFLTGSPAAGDLVASAYVTAQAQQAWRWVTRIRIVDAALRSDAADLRRWTTDSAANSRLGLLETADSVARVIHLLDPLPEALASSIRAHPERWLPALARQLTQGSVPAAQAAASLIADFGTSEYVSSLHEYERARGRGLKQRGLGRRLVHRISPTVRIRDLGRTSWCIAEKEIRLTDARRKAAALLMYLVTRPNQTATRDQVMDELWPSQDPSSAANSLHQTLYFLRREINPWYDDAITADYVPLESEVIYLNPDLIHIDSVSFARQATEALASSWRTHSALDLIRMYSGRFAPEFEYEEWAERWRARTHSIFLSLVHAASARLMDDGDHERATEVLSRALEIDDQALNLESSLVRALAALGAKDAVIQQYRHWATAYRRDYGITAPTLEELLTGQIEIPPG